MDGYIRTPEGTLNLLTALTEALYNNSNQRLGQLLINVSRCEDGSQRGLWNVHDEDWIELLRKESSEG